MTRMLKDLSYNAKDS